MSSTSVKRRKGTKQSSVELGQTLLDFSEIPPSNAPSENAEAFEQFAREFYQELYGAEVIKSVARGHDDGADLIVKVGEERWLVSCKHYRSRRSIPEDKETDPVSRLHEHGCTRFVAFYSPVASSRLANKLEGIEKQRHGFKLMMMDRGAIQRELISPKNARGWLLAFRYFPKSYARITSMLSRPLSVFEEEHVMHHLGASFVPGMGVTMHYEEGNEIAKKQATKELTFLANEIETERAYSRIFVERVADFARTFPGSFHRAAWSDEESLTGWNIFPSWDLGLVERLVQRRVPSLVHDLCRVWSLWDPNEARLVARFSRLLRDEDGCSRLGGLHFNLRDDAFRKALNELPESLESQVRWDEERLELGEIRTCPVALKGYLATLLAFSPPLLRPWPARDECLYEMSKHLGEEAQLRTVIDLFAKGLKKDDRDYVYRYPHLVDQCKDATFLLYEPSLFDVARREGLSAAHRDPTVPWVPAGETDPVLLQVWEIPMGGTLDL